MSFFELTAIYISFLIIVLAIGFLKFDKKMKTRIIVALSTIYNIAIGYIDTLFFGVIYAFLSNQPKGSSYEVPASEAGFNIILGIILLVLYILLLLPINLFMKKKSNISIKLYTLINGIATVLGIFIYWIFCFDKIKKIL